MPSRPFSHRLLSVAVLMLCGSPLVTAPAASAHPDHDQSAQHSKQNNHSVDQSEHQH